MHPHSSHHSGARAASGRKIVSRWLPLSLSVGLAGLAAWYAPRQPLREDPLAEPDAWEWFWTPREANAWLRVGRATGLGQLSPAEEPLADDLAVNGQTVLVAYRGGFVVRTDDGGKTWTPSAVPIPRPEAVTSVALVSPAEALAATGGPRLWAQRDGAQAWTEERVPGAVELHAVGAAGGVAWALEPDRIWLRTSGQWTSYELASARKSTASAPRRAPPLRPLVTGTATEAATEAPDRPATSYVKPAPYEKKRPPTSIQAAPNTPSRPGADASSPSQPRAVDSASTAAGATAAAAVVGPAPRIRIEVAPDGSFARAVTGRGTFKVTSDGAVEMLARPPSSKPYASMSDSDSRPHSQGWVNDLPGDSASEETVEGLASVRVRASAPRGTPALAWGPEGLARKSGTRWSAPEPVQVAFAPAELTHLRIDDEGNAWTVTRNGEVCSSADAGWTWQLRFAARQTFIAAQVEGRGQRVQAALSNDWLLVSDDAGETFRSVRARRLPASLLPDGSEARLLTQGDPATRREYLQYVGPGGKPLAAVRGGGQVVLLRPGGEDIIDTGGAQPILDLHRAADESWWAAGRDGLVLTSERQKAGTWARVDLGVKDPDLHLIRTSEDGKRVFVFGEAGVIRFRDPGGSWQFPRHAVAPAPWSVVAWLLAMGLAFVAARPSRRESPAQQGQVADLLVSDAPIDHPSEDVLGLHAVALTLSHFIRNEQTVPPVTLAVTGPWGSGKSSVLNLLSRDLKSRGMKPVLFNAWHHQQESDVLAALYARIIRDGVPGVLSLTGLEFRLRLLIRRARQGAVILGVLVLLVGFSIGFFSQADHPLQLATMQLERFLGLLRQLKAVLLGDPIPLLPPGAASEDMGGGFTISAALLSALGGVTGLLAALRRGLLAFGARPFTLMASLRRTLRLGDDEQRERVTFQTQFADDFRDVTEALGDRKMVLLIDDLDRCSGENLMRVLQAVNFLTSSGRCFVVLATSRTILQETVAQQADHVVLEPDEEAQLQEKDPERRRQERRQLHAARYLEKLINIEVPVPRMSEDGSQRLARGSTPLGETRRTWLQGVWARVSRTQVMVVLAALAMAAYLAGQEVGPRSSAPALPVAASTVPAPGVEAGAGLVPDAMAIAPAPPPPPDGQAPLATYRRQDPPLGEVQVVKTPGRERSRWPLAGALVVMALMMGRGLRHFRGVKEKDSPQFLEALEVWMPVIRLRNRTPRSIKRFLNRLRFIAMRRRAEVYAERWRDPELELETALRGGRWKAIARLVWDRVKDPPEEVPAGTIPEATLVAVAALEDAAPEAGGDLSRLAALRASHPAIEAAWRKHEGCLKGPVLPVDDAQMRRMRGGVAFNT
jgi:photosystem II stability/assembly factor-like uncharacterized protein